MVCPKCGQLLSGHNPSMCEHCGAILSRDGKQSSLASVRQGRAPGSSGAPRTGAAFPMSRPSDDAADMTISEQRRMRYRPVHKKQENDKNPPKLHRTSGLTLNWARILLILVILMVVLLITAWILIQTTLTGQVIMARMGRNASAEALWIYGRELMDEGYVEKAIETYEQAYNQDQKIEGLYDYLKELALAYEAGGRNKEAESIFYIMCDLNPTNTYAYEKVVDLLIKQGRKAAAAEFLQKAYEKTGRIAFNTQRTELLPKTPTASLGGGKYSSAKTLELESAEGYD
ncbi:MAG: hypothetical protein CW338_11675, partial [Clostridiales bacterium]|nr:hypothetical protein [Clostridiales bacterium]